MDIKKGVEDLAQTIERKRQEFQAYQEKNNVGTFAGLKRALRKKQDDGGPSDPGQPSPENTREDNY